IGAAWVWYGAREYVTDPLLRFGAAYRILNRRYYIDEFYMWLIDTFAIGVAYALALFDREGLDALVTRIAGLFAGTGQVLRPTRPSPSTATHRLSGGASARGASLSLSPP